MPHRTRTFKSDIAFPQGLTLFLGRTKREIKEPCRFEMRREHIESFDEPFQFISRSPVRAMFLLFINGKLFSTTVPSGGKRSTVFVRKPLRKDAKIQIHLVKKYTTLTVN